MSEKMEGGQESPLTAQEREKYLEDLLAIQRQFNRLFTGMMDEYYARLDEERGKPTKYPALTRERMTTTQQCVDEIRKTAEKLGY